MSTPRPVRIPRARTSQPAARPAATTSSTRRVNRAGTQRAVRFAFLYVVALLVLDGILAGLDLSSPEAARPAVLAGLELFLVIAVVLAVGSVVFALTPAPRQVEVLPDRTVVVGRWGGRRLLAALPELETKVARHFPAGFLSDGPVDMVQVRDQTGRRRTYQLESGLLDPAYDPEGVG